MAKLIPSKQMLALKIVYYGPGLSGKTTNLATLHSAYPADRKGDLVTLDTETERTLFFDYFDATLGKIHGFTVKADLFTVPGQSFYNDTRRAVLEGVDGIVFVADSHPDREEANLFSLENMKENLKHLGTSLESIPHVYQWNKRDVRGALSVKLMERFLNPEGAPSFEATAITGEGVWETQSAILKLALAEINKRAGIRAVG